MTTKARAEFDPMRLGVRIAVRREDGRYRALLQWEPVAVKVMQDNAAATEPTDKDWLQIDEDDARAIYEALAEYFGGAGHDTRALRNDYNAERARVDKFIKALTGGAA